jgi:hypothetical protein
VATTGHKHLLNNHLGADMDEDVKKLMYSRGERDGLAGLSPSCTAIDYWNGYVEGRRTRIELKVRYGDDTFVEENRIGTLGKRSL